MNNIISSDFIKKLIKIYGENVSLKTMHDILNDKSNYIDIYADGASYFDGNKRISGIGVFFGDNDVRNISKIVQTPTNNNECEIVACIEALKICINKYHFINMYTDSRLVVDGMNNNCSKTKYEELFKELEVLTESFIIINWIHVKGHSDIYGNIKADELSKKCFNN